PDGGESEEGEQRGEPPEELLNALPAVSDTTKLDHLKDGIDRITDLLETVCINTDAIIEIGAESIGVSRPDGGESEEGEQRGEPPEEEEERQEGPPEDQTDEDSQQETLVDREPE
ncbi:MAG TPA: hypothetical protein PKW90_03715, partial [Myxococcota bacterium]|nr:hypothetical protein [Myxococcota bacterium]